MRRALVLALLLGLASCRNGGLCEAPFVVPGMRIEGMRQVKEKELIDAGRRELERFVESGRRLADADDAAFAMEAMLREKGYPEARVTFDADGGELVFRVTEGPRPRYAGVRFPGARAEFTSDLEAFFAFKGSGFLFLGPTWVNRAEVTAAVSRVRQHYLRQGFLDVEVERPELAWNASRTEAHVVVAVTEGRQYHVTRVVLEGADPSYLGDHGLVGKPYDAAAAFALGADVRKRLRNDAYVFARTQVVAEVDEAGGGVAITVTAKPGEVTRLRRIRFQGTGSVRQSFMRNRYPLRPGGLLRLRDLESGTADLYRSRLFESIEPELKPLAPGWADVDVEVDAGNSKRIELSGGWGTWEQLWGEAEYVDHNVFRAGRVLRVGALASMRSLGGDVKLEDPWILGLDNWIWIAFHALTREERFYDYQGYGTELGVERRIDRHNRLKAGYRFDVEEAWNVAATIPADEREEIEGFQRAAGLFVEYVLDHRNDLFVPTDGAVLRVSSRWSTDFLGASLTFVELEARGAFYVPIRDGSVLAFGGFAGTRQPYDGTVMPIQQRYFLGGQHSVRSFGYEELTPTDAFGKGVGGLTAWEGHVEWRQRIWEIVHGALFVDVGQVSPEPFSLDAPLGWGLGAGLRLYTPVGPVRLDGAYNPGELFAASKRFRVHFSFGFSF